MVKKMVFNPIVNAYTYEDDQPDPSSGIPDLTPAIQDRLGVPSTSPSTPSNTAANPTSLNDFGDYDPSYESNKTNLTSMQNQAEEDYSTGLQRFRTQFPGMLQQAGQARDDTLQNFIAQMAQNGILRSSNNLEGQGRINSAYQNQVSALTDQQQQGEEGLAQQRLSRLREAQMGLTSAEGQHAGYLANVASARAQRQAATEAAQQATQQLQNQFTTTPTGQYMPNPVPQQMPPSPGGSGQFGIIPEQPQVGQPQQSPYSQMWADQQSAQQGSVPTQYQSPDTQAAFPTYDPNDSSLTGIEDQMMLAEIKRRLGMANAT